MLFSIGWLWGDPHFVTLDGTNYTFNGLGEYTMVNAKNGHFELQARTKFAKGGGTATIFFCSGSERSEHKRCASGSEGRRLAYTYLIS